MTLSNLELTAARVMLENGLNPCYQGHLEWVSSGHANCGCHAEAACSVPVYHCTVCGDSDYGDNEEADEQRKLCYELHGNYMDEDEYVGDFGSRADDPEQPDNDHEGSK